MKELGRLQKQQKKHITKWKREADKLTESQAEERGLRGGVPGGKSLKGILGVG